LTRSRDFWLACGHHLLDRDADGFLPVTDDFLKAYLARPELTPPPEACDPERALHQALLADPQLLVTPAEIATIADADARENWGLLIAWRDQLIRHVTLEAAYLDIVRHSRTFPHIFINQLLQVILRNVLDSCDDSFVLRAAEMFFRPQRLTLQEGAFVAADEETIAGVGGRPLSPLITMLGLPPGAEIEVLSETNIGTYWDRSDVFDLALDLTSGRRGLAALGEVIRLFVSHLLAVRVEIEPVTELRDVILSWYVGLDVDGTRIGDALWNDDAIDEATRSRLIGLYRLTFVDDTDMAEKVRGKPVYLLTAMTADRMLRLKPQNLLTGLPIRQREAVN
jgi:Family of unknown function (DUF6352)